MFRLPRPSLEPADRFCHAGTPQGGKRMLMTVDAEEIANETQRFAPAEDPESEERLSSEITMLWSAHQDGKATAKRTRAELQKLRRDLGETAAQHEDSVGPHWPGWSMDVLSPAGVYPSYLSGSLGTRPRRELESGIHKTPPAVRFPNRARLTWRSSSSACCRASGAR